MPVNIPGHKLLIISDSAVYKSGNIRLAYEPVSREVEYLSELFDEIIWLGCKVPKDTTVLRQISNPKIRVITMPSVRHQSFNALFVLLSYPVFIYYILKYLPVVTHVHTRGPSHPAWLGIQLSRFDNKRRYWHKYAGNWLAEKLPNTYNKQRRLLKRINKNNVKVTVNGKCADDNKHIYSFENPCITETERAEAKIIADNKIFSESLNLLFVGELNRKKGILQLLDAISDYKMPQAITDLYVAGSGPLADNIREKISGIKSNLKIHLLGILNREQLNEYYKKCHFLILPSFSEGFPKVIAEAAAYGCIPVVTRLSSIDQYIYNRNNGFLLPANDPQNIMSILEDIPYDNLKQMSYNITTICRKFTYEYFLHRIRTEIFNG